MPACTLAAKVLFLDSCALGRDRQVGIARSYCALTVLSTPPTSAASLASPAGRGASVVDDDIVVWDSLAICEYLADKYPDKNLWPNTLAHRARARSLCRNPIAASGLRSACPMNIEAQLPHVGAQLWEENSALREDMARLEAMRGARARPPAGPHAV